MRIHPISLALRALRGEKSIHGRPLPDRADAVQCLHSITGQYLGDDAAAWGAWLRANRWVYHARPGDLRAPRNRRVLAAAAALGADSLDGFVYCDQVIRLALSSPSPWTRAMEVAVCNTGYEQPDVARAYSAIRDLVDQGLLDGKGDLRKPAGPRYTACGINDAGRRRLETS